MICLKLVSILVLSVPILGDQKINNKKFPVDFLFGVATSAYQIEGAWNEDGKGQSVWDNATHSTPYLFNNSNGDTACDSYHKYKEDIKMLKYLGVTHYRFSISWPRILPTGFSNKINPLGVKYYRDLIKALKDNNIEPVVTIHHSDLPQALYDAGAWTNPSIIKWYTDYVKVCLELFGDLVKYWITVNEPLGECILLTYRAEQNNSSLTSSESVYQCTHNILLSHASVYHLYNDTYRKTQKGKMGITLSTAYYEPESNKTEDITAADNKLLFNFGWYAHPIVTGDYPSVMKERLARRSKAAGLEKSVLPEFSNEMSKYMKGTFDFIGLNMYTSYLTKAKYTNQSSISWFDSIEADAYQPSSWKKTATTWLSLTPWGLGKLVEWISKTYGKIPIIITENGMSDNGTSLQDDIRIEQIQTYLSSLKYTMDSGNVNVLGYFHWSVMDNFEWFDGYSSRFGLYHVDFNDPNRTRTPKKSVEYYKKVIKTRCLVDFCRE